MSFIHPLLLGGLLLITIPIVIHLIMQQKPKRLPFPAFRFLAQKIRTNQRKLRLRHLLLLLLRMAIIALLCLALARPRLLGEDIGLVTDRPLAVALVIDTSMSMEYKEGSKGRLDEVKRRALEVIDELPEGSRIAVFDSSEVASGEWQPTLPEARKRVAELQLRPANGPVSDAVAAGYRLLHSLDDEPDQPPEPMPRVLYVFSDRTEGCWDASRNQALQDLRDRGKQKVLAGFVDVGVAKPIDLAIAELKLPRQLIPANSRLIVHVTMQATGQEAPDLEVRCRIDGEKDPARQVVKLRAGQSDQVTFDRPPGAVGLHQAEITLASSDNLPFNNARYVTFEVTAARKVLVLCDNPKDAAFWESALRVGERTGELSFACDVKAVADARETDLAGYQAVCLLSVAAPNAELWGKLRRYVAAGGGLAILPGSEVDPARYNDDEEARQLMPAKLGKVVRLAADKGLRWDLERLQHPLAGWFEDWKRRVPPPAFIVWPPTAVRYWEAEPLPQAAFPLALYEEKQRPPALLERKLDRDKFRGRVILFTTAFDTSAVQWNNYLTTEFYLTLAKSVVGYLSGDAQDAKMNHLCRPQQGVVVTLPPEGRFPRYVLQGPGLLGQAGLVTRNESQNELRLMQAQQAGNFVLVAEDSKWRTGFSMNIPPEESRLEQAPVELIEAVFGPKSVLPVGHGLSFRDALAGHWSQPVELLPWLMLALLLALALENLLANKFYRKPAQESENREIEK